MTDEEIAEMLKQKGVTCRSCWWQEGGRCYVEPCEREATGHSKKMATNVCHKHSSKRSVLGQLFGDKLTIVSEEKDKANGGDGTNY